MTAITDKNLSRAYARTAIAMLKDKEMTSSATSVGFVTRGKKGQRQGYQVFVKVCRYSDELLRKRKTSGGLTVVP